MSGPVTQNDRITNLDTVRGIATLCILIMNAVMYGIGDVSYYKLDALGTNNVIDWIVGIFGEIFIDQKAMAIFSMLFGAGIVLFADRAAAKGKRHIPLSLWRNFLLLVIGGFHAWLWEGDILRIYAICAPILLLLRKQKPKFLLMLGGGMFALAILIGIATQLTISDPVNELGAGYWIEGGAMSDAVGLWFISNIGLRSLGAMLIGVALYRIGFMSGEKEKSLYTRTAIWGLGLGIPLATTGVIWQAAANYKTDIAIVGQLPNDAATMPMALAFISLITLWDKKPTTPLHTRIRSVGQMALTNYLTQTIIGVTVFSTIFERGELGRGAVAIFIILVWALQLIWSQAWLTNFRFGPSEWMGRCMTYRKLQPIKRQTPK